MLKIRLTRTGKKKQPSYRVVVANKDSKRDGRIVERIGHYNPLIQPAEYRIHEDRALYWLSVGAQPTDAVRRLLEKQGTMGRLQRFHAGESMDSLVAEYTGEPVMAAVAVETTATASTAVEVEAADAEEPIGEEVIIEVVEVDETTEAEIAGDEVVVEEAAEEVADEDTTGTESE